MVENMLKQMNNELVAEIGGEMKDGNDLLNQDIKINPELMRKPQLLSQLNPTTTNP